MTASRAFLLFAALSIFLTLFYQLGNMAFIGADEPRYARIGEEMLLRGDYVTPTLNFRPWLEKPPLLFWMAAASQSIFGAGEFGARFPVAVTALLGVLFAGFFAWRTRGVRPAILTTMILTTCGLYFTFGRAASTDMPLTAFLTGALAFAFLACEKRGPYAVLAGVCLALAVLAKGIVAVILLAGVMGLYFVLLDEFRLSLKQSVEMTAAFLLCSIPWHYFVWLENGYDFVATFWINHHLARFVTDLHHHTQPLWFFVPILIVGLFPWTFFLTTAANRIWLAGRRLRAEDRDQLFLALWMALPVLFFSLSSSKLAGYILPSIPPAAILIAREWDAIWEGDFLARLRLPLTLALTKAFLLIFSLLLLFGMQIAYRSSWIGALLALPLLAAVCWIHFDRKEGRLPRAFLALAGAAATTAGLAAWVAAPVFQDYHSAQYMALLARPHISREQPLIQYRYFHHTALYYTDYQATDEAVSGMDNLHKWMVRNPQSEYWLITQNHGFQELEREPAAELVAVRGNLYLFRLHTE